MYLVDYLIEIANGTRELPKSKIDVNMHSFGDEFPRKLTKVTFKNKKGVKWLYWYWERDLTDADIDCGYSGIILSYFEESKKEQPSELKVINAETIA